MATNDITQQAVELVIDNPNANADLSQLAVEIITTFGENYLDQVAVELVMDGHPNADLAQLAVEVVIDNPAAPAPPVPPFAHTRVLTPVDTWDLDSGFQNWPGEFGRPFAWWENTLQQQQFGLSPTPGDVGTIGLLYIALAQTLTGNDIGLVVPDDWTPYILWGALADLLGADGQSFDPVRSQYCQRRYQEGVELARLVLGGQG